jgi:hypothetical protein
MGSQDFDKKWQFFYVKYRNNKNSGTKLEVNFDGRIGDRGFIDLENLFNYGELRIRAGKEYNIRPENITRGLMALLLLSYDDIVKNRKEISINEDDIEIYRDIMKKAGTSNAKHSKKYRKYLKVAKDEETQELDYESPTKEHSLKTLMKYKRGYGLFAYNKVSDLEQKLHILLGSLQAGNNSEKIKNDAKSILDKLLDLNEILPIVHKKLFQKFKL